MTLAKDLLEVIQKTAKRSPHIFAELYSTWDYLSNDERSCHPRTTALLAHAAWTLPSNPAVELEFKFTVEGRDPETRKKKWIKWQPDMTLRSKAGHVLLLVDFESPNSSDFRVIDRDIISGYLNWIVKYQTVPEYLIITSLPDDEAPHWKCRYSEGEQGLKMKDVRRNPFRYWYAFYKECFKKHPEWKKYPIRFANFDGSTLNRVGFADVARK
jgi:hypothetical protein